MKTKFYLGVAAAILVSLSCALGQYGSGQQQQAQPPKGAAGSTPAGKKPGEVLTGGAIVATPITEEEAKKKYPMPGGRPFPPGDRDIHKPSGWIISPYSHTVYDCSNVPQGGLVLDTKVNKVFERPRTK